MGSLNQYACFNELSFLDQEEDEDALSLFINYAKTIQALKQKGFNGIRYEYGITSLNKDGIRNIYELHIYLKQSPFHFLLIQNGENSLMLLGVQKMKY